MTMQWHVLLMCWFWSTSLLYFRSGWYLVWWPCASG